MKTIFSSASCYECLQCRGYLFETFYKSFPVFAIPKNGVHIFSPRANKCVFREMEKPKYMFETAFVQIIGSGARGAPKCIQFATDYGRYLFNCGEGTQRLFDEHNINISRVKHIFVTHPSWENTGGLLGVGLTIQSTGAPEVTVHGPPGIETIFAATSRIVIFDKLRVQTTDCSKSSSYDDETVHITCVPLIKNKRSEESEVDIDDSSNFFDTLSKAKEEDNTDYYVYLKRKARPLKRAILTPPKERYAALAMAYICKMKPKPETLSLELCVEHGVPPGPLMNKLRNGENITLPDGKLVKFSDVNEPYCPGPVFIVIDCPSTSFLDSLSKENKFEEHQMGALDENIAKYIFHFTPSVVMNDEKYQHWMKRFPDTTLHINVNDSNSCLGNIKPHLLQYKLNHIDSDVFPLLKDRSIPVVKVPLNKKLPMNFGDIMKRNNERIFSYIKKFPVNATDLNIPPHVGHTLKFIDLRSFKRNTSTHPTCIYMNPKSAIEDMYFFEEFSAEYKLLKSKLLALSDQINSYNKKNPFPVITFLGTGSSRASKTRGASGILITFSKDSHMIMDCGEGTYNQMVRHFGADEVDKILASTKAIYVSHLHPDHHMGAINLLKRRREAVNKLNSGNKKVYLLAPRQISFWLYNYHLHIEPILDCIDPITNQELLFHNNNDRSNIIPLLEALSVKEIKTANVRHCPFSFGVTVTDSNNRKITYSGDTMPSENLVDLGMDSDLLIHEATFEDGLVHRARFKMHSTFSEAIGIGKRMNAKFTILTHFSQRYRMIPPFNENFDHTVGVAFDNMRVRLGDLKKLPLYNPVLSIIFCEEIEDLKEKLLESEIDEFTE